MSGSQTIAKPVLRPSELVEEYEKKLAALAGELERFNSAGASLRMACAIGGEWGGQNIDTGRVYDTDLKQSLLCSAWRHLYKSLQIERLASANEKRLFEQSMAKPAPFTIDNIRATFGPYVKDPRGAILRSFAEAFTALDPAYKSHEKVKIGVKGLPKRVILESVSGYGSWGRDRLQNILNALAAYEDKPLVTHQEIEALMNDGYALLEDGEVQPNPRYDETIEVIGRGIWLKRFKNGNGHLFFNEATLRCINLALAEYYGEVLADCSDDDATTTRRESKAVAKDLQYYPTPKKVVDRVLSDVLVKEGMKALEPSCGCGRFLDALAVKGADCFGVEVNHERAEQCRRKGHSVHTGNFLEMVPTGDFDLVVMNPPFYGRHYAKHVEHALKFLKPGGQLVAILPITARYDHALVDGRWRDLPTGSFSESGTNIGTSILMKWAPEETQRATPLRDLAIAGQEVSA